MNPVAASDAYHSARVSGADAVSQRSGQPANDFPNSIRLLQEENGVAPNLFAAFPRLLVREVGAAGHEKRAVADPGERAGETLLIGQRRQSLPLPGDGAGTGENGEQ